MEEGENPVELDSIKLKNSLYYMESFIITCGDLNFEVPRTMIASFNVEKQFEDMIYPLYYVSMMVPLWVYEKITKDPRNLYVTMHLQYTLVDDVDSAYTGSPQFYTEIKGKFLAYIPYSTQPADAEHQDSISKESKTYNKTYEYDEGVLMEMALYNEAAYKASFNTNNAVLVGVNPADIMGYLLNVNGIKNVVMDKPDRATNFSQFIILPQSGVKNILRLTDEFKFHNEGSIVFFDLVDSYIVSKKIGCTSWRNNEHKCVYIMTLSSYSDGMDKFSGIYVNDKEKSTLLAINEDSFSIQKPDSSPLLRSQPNMEFLTITTANALLNLFTPNKEFQFAVDDLSSKKYNGKYRIHSLSMIASPKGEYLDPVFTAVFRK